MVLYSCQNAQQDLIKHNDLDKLANSVQETLIASSNADPPGASVFTLAPTKYTKEDL